MIAFSIHVRDWSNRISIWK